MLLDLLLEYHKNKLERMINNNVDYDLILKESQKLGELINIKMRRTMKTR